MSNHMKGSEDLSKRKIAYVCSLSILFKDRFQILLLLLSEFKWII